MKPLLRFDNYNEDWKSVKLSETGFLKAGGTPSTSVPSFWDGDINWLQSGAVHNNIIRPESVVRKITLKGLNNSAAYLTKPDSVLIAITGATCANVGYLTFPSSANQSVISLEPSTDYDAKFLYQNLLTQRKQILSFRGGSAQGGVSLGNIKEITIGIPSSKEEQKVIGSFLFSLDEIINASSSCLQKLEQARAASMQAMFPQEGGITPKVRFKGFDDKWISVKLGEIFMERHEASTITQELPQLSFTIAEGIIRPENRKSNKRDFLITMVR